MRTRVKYCGLVRPQDVDAAVAIGADAIGFVFYPRSPRLLDPDTAAALRRRLPSWVTAVGLFVNETPEVIGTLARRVGLDVIQLHGDETAEQARSLQATWWKAIRIGAVDPLVPARGASGGASGSPSAAAHGIEEPAGAFIRRSLNEFADAEFCLLDSLSPGYGGSGQTFDWTLVPKDASARLIMSGGLDASNVGAAVARVRPFGVDTSSGIQAEDPRRKDVGRMEQFMEAVRRADGKP
jgi:phosphoribosylanthranilate isomerase